MQLNLRHLSFTVSVSANGKLGNSLIARAVVVTTVEQEKSGASFAQIRNVSFRDEFSCDLEKSRSESKQSRARGVNEIRELISGNVCLDPALWTRFKRHQRKESVSRAKICADPKPCQDCHLDILWWTSSRCAASTPLIRATCPIGLHKPSFNFDSRCGTTIERLFFVVIKRSYLTSIDVTVKDGATFSMFSS